MIETQIILQLFCKPKIIPQLNVYCFKKCRFIAPLQICWIRVSRSGAMELLVFRSPRVAQHRGEALLSPLSRDSSPRLNVHRTSSAPRVLQFPFFKLPRVPQGLTVG